MTTYIVTVRLRTGEEIQRKWTSAEDSTDAVFLTLTSITDEQKERVSKVDVKEQA